MLPMVHEGAPEYSTEASSMRTDMVRQECEGNESRVPGCLFDASPPGRLDPTGGETYRTTHHTGTRDAPCRRVGSYRPLNSCLLHSLGDGQTSRRTVPAATMPP